MSEERALSEIVWTPERGLSEPEIRGISWNNLLLSDEQYSGKWRTAAEIRVTPESALSSTVVLACCRILAETISSLPLHVYRRGEDGHKEIARDIPLYKVLSFAPNSWQTKFEFFEQMVMTLCLWGNSYTQIKSGKYGSVSELINLHPSRMDVERLENGRLRYSYTNPETGRLERFTQDQIMHVRWTAEPDGIKGMVPVEVAREAIALARACEIHASKYWANSARPGVVLQTDGSLTADAAERLRENWERLHRGVDRAFRTAVLTNGLKAEPIGFTQEQSQFIDSRKFQSEEIARVYRLPLSLVQGQSGGNPEINGQEFVTYTLVPWLRRIESAISRSLIYNDDLFVAEFDTKGLMRGDSNSRAGFYSTMIGLGIYSINDARRAEGMSPLKDGDHHFVAMNTQTLEEAVKPKPEPMAGAPGAPPPAIGGVPSLPQVKTGVAPTEAPKGIKSEPKVDQEGRALSESNQELYDAQEKIVAENGKWPQDGPRGAHYMESNPFASRGIACRNCVYFQRGNACEIVQGTIEPSAICKLWIIPEEKLAMPERRNCGTGAGGFASGNSCASGASERGDERIRGTRVGKDGKGKQTKVARKLYQMGSSERQIKQLIRDLGGKPGRSMVDMEDGKVNVFVRDHSGNETFYVQMGYNGAAIIPTDDISDDRVAEIESFAKQAFPETISSRLWGRGQPYPIDIQKNSSKLIATGKAAPTKKDRRSADCGRDEGGRFGGGNDCASNIGGGRIVPIMVGDKSLTKYVPFRSVGETKNSEFISIPTDEDVKAAMLKKDGEEPTSSTHKTLKIGAHRELPDGTPVALRIDIPTFNQSTKRGKSVYAVTVHKGDGGKAIGKVLGYDSVARLSGHVSFESKEGDAYKVVTGETTKIPLATVKGAFSKSREIPDDIDSWTPVGFDPQKTAYFYDKRTGREVTGGTDAVSVGNTVFVREPEYGKRKASTHYRAADSWGLAEFRADCGRDESGRFGSGNDCAADGNDGGGSGGSSASGEDGDGSPKVAVVPPTGNLSAPDSERIDVGKLLEKIAANPDGFTLDRRTAEQPEDGIMVSEFPNDSRRAIQIKAGDIDNPETAERFARWIAGNMDVIRGRDDRYIGGWSSGGTFYLDIATRFPPNQPEQALNAGRKAGQLAVFNLSTFKETWVQYESGDSRKPKDWDAGFAKARVTASKKQVYDQDSPAMQDEDHAAELSQHGRKTVRSLMDAGYNFKTAMSVAKVLQEAGFYEQRDQAAGRSDEGLRAGGVPVVQDVHGEGSEGQRQDAASELVCGRSGRDAVPLRGSADAGRLIDEARSVLTAAGIAEPSVDVRSFGNARAIASYSLADDVVYVSDALPGNAEESFRTAESSGWLSQWNPVVHEAAHRHHAECDLDSFRSSVSVAFDDEQRATIESQVSRYAATNGREFVAEVLAGKWSGKQYGEDVSSLFASVTNGRVTL